MQLPAMQWDTMCSMRRSKLTVAAEMAGIGALAIAIAALVVVVFFDTGVRMPWDTNTSVQSNTSVTSAPTSEVRINPSQNPVIGPTRTAPEGENKPNEGSSEDEHERSRADFWTSWIGLSFLAAVTYLITAVASIVVGFFIDVLFSPLNPVAAGVVISVPLTTMVYLWLLWPFFSTSGLIVFFIVTLIASIAFSFLMEDFI
ncbi:hypothetical protein E1288_30175 [Saccharopolyspora elongata]|uniref:Uncharacterized protein n=1 Tax=Saccharopolyspora elongata TaxID=2530387 RepID=A0A4V2YKG2_9PSEU|nr:hypothetical protein E1288_30175 [Saccharopolyspora elongata]